MNYRIAGLTLRCDPDPGLRIEAFRPFAAAEGERPALRFDGSRACPDLPFREHRAFELAEGIARCRYGETPEGLRLEMRRAEGLPVRFDLPSDTGTVRSDIALGRSPDAALLRFGLWFSFGLRGVVRGALPVHASAIVCRGRAVLFLGESGTGKSTHSRLWLDAFADTALLNDDSPVVRTDGAAPLACGSPWSGKTPCYRNEEYPIAGFVRLAQAPHNRIERLTGIRALGALLPSCPPAATGTPRLHDALYDTLSLLLAAIPVFGLECRPDPAAARLVRRTLFADL